MEHSIKLNELLNFVASFNDLITFTWKVQIDSFIHNDMRLGSLESPKGRYVIISHMTGTVKSLPKDSRDSIPIDIAECEHDTSYGDMCIYCGQIPKNIIHKSYRGFNIAVSFTREKALKEEAKYMNELFKRQKLMLVFDLDHTLVHTCSANSIDSASAEEGMKFTDETGFIYVVKLRPYLFEFFKEIEPLFEVYVYSHGSQKYANAIAKLIDPDRKIIRKGRILGRDEGEVNLKAKNLENLLPADQTASIVIDDRNDVWTNKRNLILIFPFVYFKCEAVSYDRNMYPILPAKSQDCSLFYFGKLLKNVHGLFYDFRSKCEKGADVRQIITLVRTYILKYVKVNMSSLGWTEEELIKSNEYRMIIEMGGSVETNISEDCMVLSRKYNEQDETIIKAEAKGIKIVDAKWLMFCSRYWRKLPIEPFIITKETVKVKVNEQHLINEIKEQLEDWKCQYYDEILKELLEMEQITNNESVKKKKVDE